jgi:hypothetical protein
MEWIGLQRTTATTFWPSWQLDAKAEFDTIRERLFKIGARVVEHAARIRIQLPTSCPEGRYAPLRFASRHPAHERRGIVLRCH